MEMQKSSLVVELSYPDLVISVGEITLGEANRKKLQKTQREKEREKFTQAACALLNSGGGVIRMEMANNDEHHVEMGLDLEECLRTLIMSKDLQAFFDTKQQGRCYYVFVKSWNSDPFPEDRSIKPRICSLSSSLYCRSLTSVVCMDSSEAFNFLKTKKRNTETLKEEPSCKVRRVTPRYHNSNPAYLIFERDQLEYGEILPFPESQHVEFKQFSTKHIVEYVKSTIPEYISAFANTEEGYLFIGVDDKTKKVLGCPKENVDCNALKMKIEATIAKLPRVHFCQSQSQLTYTVKILNVLANGELYGYACVIRVQPFCCAVFSEAPKSWMVKDKNVCSLTTEEWVDMMMDADPDLLCLSKEFESQLSLSSSPPLSRPVYSKKGLEHKKTLQRLLFPVTPGDLQYTPKSLWEELSSEHEGLEELINKQMQPFSHGILILSRSWAVDLNLQEKQGVICDALLVTENSPPIFYTILRKQDADGKSYCTGTAFTLKQKLVNMGGYTGKLCVMTKVLHLSPESNAESSEGSGSLINYPKSYNLANAQQMEDLLQSLVIVLLSFRSFLSDQLGCEILNLLTVQQYEIFSKNIRKNRELFVQGLPGSGKTIIAMKIMEKIKNVFGCEENEILYVCENQLLRNSIGNKGICCAVTRKTFMSNDFEKIQHIIIDEAQNFRNENGDWYKKAKTITQRGEDSILWVFLDYFQTSHMDDSGLPRLSDQNSREELTRVVRNADPIAKYLQRIMQKIRVKLPRNIPQKSLEILREAEWCQGVPGFCTIKKCSNLQDIGTYVAEKCQWFLRNGYSPDDIVVLCSTIEEVEKYKDYFSKPMRKRTMSQNNDTSILANNIMFESIRRFSGLERNIVFGINPSAAESAIFYNLLLCLASRARKHLYIVTLLDWEIPT
ncbi:schlafen family member 11 [Rhinolophus ferrumequinum]|uniref:Schlafen family member 11 n=1 Tax=Rhinolophus ferrumequinum TaxID=59479 RepID=A0A7J7TG86_RHIFE|nr:schlafen family member 11 [Rhinolophus ferrumequinum]